MEDDICESRVTVAGSNRHTIVIFDEENIPTRLGTYPLTGALLAVDPVRQQLAPTHACGFASKTMY